MTDDYLLKFDLIIFQTYVYPILSLFGLVFTIFIFLIFSNSSFKQNIYVFLKYESVFIWLDLCATAFPIIIYRPEWDKAYFRCFYRLYFIGILKSVLEMTGILCHIMSSIELFLLISNKTKPKSLQKVPNLTIGLILFLISCFIYSYMFFVSYIDEEPYRLLYNNGTNITSLQFIGYKVRNTEFNDSMTKKLIEIIAFSIRDGLNLIVLIALNVMIYLKVKKAMTKKKKMLNQNFSVNTTNNKTEMHNNGNNKLKRSERNTAFMVIIVSICYTIGRIPIMISFIVRNVYEETNGMRIFKITSVISVILSYDSYFFIYYFTNKNFRNLFTQYLIRANKKYRN